MHVAKIGFEEYSLYKMRYGMSEPICEEYAMKGRGNEGLNAGADNRAGA